MRFGLGYIRDADHKRLQKDARRLLLDRGLLWTLPASATLEQFEAPIFDQGQTGSCTGHGTAQGIYTAFAAAGMNLPWVPSPAGIYGVTRCLERQPNPDGSFPALDDGGAMPADVMSAISRWGIRPIGERAPDGRNSDVTPSNVNDEPQLIDLEASARKVVVGEYRISETAIDVVDQVCAAISAGIPVGVGIFVDMAFEDWQPGHAPIGAPNLNDPNGGGHWVCLTSYRETSSGRVLRGPNSWGTGWGDRGHFEVSEAWIRAAWDIYALNVGHS